MALAAGACVPVLLATLPAKSRAKAAQRSEPEQALEERAIGSASRVHLNELALTPEVQSMLTQHAVAQEVYEPTVISGRSGNFKP